MNDSHDQTERLDLSRLLGIILLLLAFFGLYWVVEAVFQLWNSPRSVPFVSLFIDLLEDNQKPIIRSSDGSEINLPASWPIVIGLFLSIVLISSIGLLVRSLLSKALRLLFPQLNSPDDAITSALKSKLTKRRE